VRSLIVVSLVLCLALFTGCSGTSGHRADPSVSSAPTRTVPTRPVAPPGPAVPTAGAYLGVWRGPGPGRPDDADTSLQQLETQLGRRVAVDHRYYDWGAALPSAEDRRTASDGRIPMVSICDCRFGDGAAVRWSTIADGSQDPWLAATAASFASWGVPAFVVFGSEPEDHLATNGTAAEYRAAFRHVVEVFRANHADRVAFVWATTGYALRPEVGRASEVDAVYPGDDAVDWIAADPYNFFRDGRWESFASVTGPWYEWARATHPGKPLMLAEWGSKEDPATPGRKAAWIAAAVQDLRTRFARVRAAVYFDEQKHERGEVNDWRIDTSAGSLSAFVALARSPWFAP
jgi:hypothetical protein